MLLLTEAVYAGATLSDEDFAGMTQGFTSREIVELLLTIGYYTMLVCFMQVLAIDLDAPAGERLLVLATSNGPRGG